MSLTMGLDVLMVALLMVAIVYAIVLDHHLSSTRENNRMLAGLIDQFYQAAARTNDEILKLKNTQEKFQQSLQKDMEKALKLKQDLVAVLEAIDKKTVMTPRGYTPVFDAGYHSHLQDVTPEISQREEELLLALKDLK